MYIYNVCVCIPVFMCVYIHIHTGYMYAFTIYGTHVCVHVYMHAVTKKCMVGKGQHKTFWFWIRLPHWMWVSAKDRQTDKSTDGRVNE